MPFGMEFAVKAFDRRLRILLFLFSATVHGALLWLFADTIVKPGEKAKTPLKTHISISFQRPTPTPKAPEPELEPEPIPEPVPEPEPEPAPKPKPIPKPKPKLEPKPKAKPKPVPRSEPKPDSKPVAADPTPTTTQATMRSDPADRIRTYRSIISAEIERHKNYPRTARKNGIRGTVQIRFRINRDGSVDGLQVSGGHRILRIAARKAVRRAAPLPPPPPGASIPFAVSFGMEFTLD